MKNFLIMLLLGGIITACETNKYGKYTELSQLRIANCIEQKYYDAKGCEISQGRTVDSALDTLAYNLYKMSHQNEPTSSEVGNSSGTK